MRNQLIHDCSNQSSVTKVWNVNDLLDGHSGAWENFQVLSSLSFNTRISFCVQGTICVQGQYIYMLVILQIYFLFINLFSFRKTRRRKRSNVKTSIWNNSLWTPHQQESLNTLTRQEFQKHPRYEPVTGMRLKRLHLLTKAKNRLWYVLFCSSSYQLSFDPLTTPTDYQLSISCKKKWISPIMSCFFFLRKI